MYGIITMVMPVWCRFSPFLMRILSFGCLTSILPVHFTHIVYQYGLNKLLPNSNVYRLQFCILEGSQRPGYSSCLLISSPELIILEVSFRIIGCLTP